MKAHKQKRLLRRLWWEPFMRLFCFHVVVKHALPPKPEKDLTQQGESIKNGERRFTGTWRTLTRTRHCTLDGLLVPLMARFHSCHWLDWCARGPLRMEALYDCYSWTEISGGAGGPSRGQATSWAGHHLRRLKPNLGSVNPTKCKCENQASTSRVNEKVLNNL